MNIWHAIGDFVTTWGPNPLVDLLAGSLLTLIIVFFRQIGHFISFVFKWIRAILSKRGKDYAFERAYLTWIINQHRYLGLLPARVVTARWGEEGRNVDLEKVYVSLHVSAQGGDTNTADTSTIDPSSWRKQPPHFSIRLFMLFIIFTLSIANTSYLRYSLITGLAVMVSLLTLYFLIFFITRSLVLIWQRREETYQLGDLALAIDTHKQLVIRGDPGSGKTTMLRYLAVTCARALRNSKKHGDTSDMVKKRLLWATRPFPIMVTLRRYSNVALWNEEKRFIDVFAEEIPRDLRKRYPEGFFERKLAAGNCLILLDAFDELGSPEARTAMAHRIEDFLSIHDHPHNRVVVTTRIVGYEGQLDRYGFQRRTIQQLNVGEIRALIKQRYEAIALSETASWQSHDAAPIKQDMRRHSERLIKKVESTPRLAQLATNPLLLSLIVLVHRVKLELPEERVQLYRECVEILAEQWKSFKWAESDLQPVAQEDLNLSQKLVLLQALALNMQQKREEEDRQTFLPQSKALEIIADKLPDILGSQLPATEDERCEVCHRKAEAWVKGIQVESGILVEQGLDEAGDPLIGFSHLTFQEYLAALAINETPSQQHLLTAHLLQPTWREVILLYVALTSDATPIIAQLLNAPQQPESLELAGLCLAEKVKHVTNETQHLTLTKLKDGFEHADDSMAKTFGPILAAIGGNEVTAFMRGQLHGTVLARRLEAIKALAQTKSADSQIKDVQEDLIKLLETPNDVSIIIATREALAQIDDSHFTGAPVVVHIPQQTRSIPSSSKIRVFDYWCFKHFHPLRQRFPDKSEFAIGKYPVTNIEYANFVKDTGHSAPKYWIEGAYPAEKVTHPVTGVTIEDAEAYCKWLSKETGKTYRLPTEWEWEWAATGPQGWHYPWGEQFDNDKCNTKGAAIGETTPVGSYLNGTNQYGATDMIGNVWEETKGYEFFYSFCAILGGLAIYAALGGVIGIIVSIVNGWINSNLTLEGILRGALWGTLVLVGLGIVIVLAFLILRNPEDVPGVSLSISCILRGGAFDTTLYSATCFSRESYIKPDKNVGFRCLKEP